jgi:hypothetical protein
VIKGLTQRLEHIEYALFSTLEMVYEIIENDFLKTPKSSTTTIHFFKNQHNQQQQLNLSTLNP